MSQVSDIDHDARVRRALFASVVRSLQMRASGSDDSYVAPNVDIPDYRRLFGGQLLGQAIGAAELSAPGKHVRTLHVTFLAEGIPGDDPVEWRLRALHDGRSFSNRYVEGVQSGRTLVAGLISLFRPGHGLEHQAPPPAVPRPGGLTPEAGIRSVPAQMHVGDGFGLRNLDAHPPAMDVWMTLPEPVADATSPLTRQLLAYCSDGTMMATVFRPHQGMAMGGKDVVYSAITSHSMTFHRSFALEGPALLVQAAPCARDGAGYVRGDWYVDDQLVASCEQSVVVRIAQR